MKKRGSVLPARMAGHGTQHPAALTRSWLLLEELSFCGSTMFQTIIKQDVKNAALVRGFTGLLVNKFLKSPKTMYEDF